MNEILTHSGGAEDVLSSLKSEKEELASSLEMTNSAVSRLEAEKEKSNAKIVTLNSTIVDLQSRNAHLVKDVQTSKSELNELLSRSEKLTANYQSLELEMGDCLKQLRLATDEKVEIFTKMSDEEARWKEVVADLEGSLADKTLEINRLHGELHSLTSPPTLAENCVGGSDDVDSLKNEIVDLKSLLASANACVHEARSATLLADQELEEKELQLENALGNLAEQEEARRIAEDKIRSVEMSHRNSSTRSDSEEELLRDMECKFVFATISLL
jgi:chromosome segregation ATPase